MGAYFYTPLFLVFIQIIVFKKILRETWHIFKIRFPTTGLVECLQLLEPSVRDAGFAGTIGLPIMVECRKVLLALPAPGNEVGLAGGVFSCTRGGGVLGSSGASGTGELGGVGGLSSSASSATASTLSTTAGGG